MLPSLSRNNISLSEPRWAVCICACVWMKSWFYLLPTMSGFCLPWGMCPGRQGRSCAYPPAVRINCALHACTTEQGCFHSVQSLSCVRLCNPMDCSTPGLPVHHQLFPLSCPKFLFSFEHLVKAHENSKCVFGNSS